MHSAGTRVVLCDLDDTLFDHHRASETALKRLCDAQPHLKRESFDELFARHRSLLDTYQLEFLAGRMTLDEARIARFQGLLGNSTDAARALSVAREYRRMYEQCWYPVAGARALAAAIKDAGVSLIVVTNNSVEEQQLKLRQTGLAPFVDALVTSEESGLTKPDPEIFRYALNRVAASPGEAVMLGDSWEMDIVGARSAGIRAVWFNRFGAQLRDSHVQELHELEPVERALTVLLRRT